jgi:acetyl esterase/lipase
MVSRTPPTSLDLPPGCAARFHPAVAPLDGGRHALLLWLPGGGFTGELPPAGHVSPEMLAGAGADVVVLALPRPPANPFPAGVAAAFDALQALAREARRLTGSAGTALLVGGEDAGGNLAAALALMARDQQAPALAGQVLVSPMLDPRLGSASMRRGACGDGACPYTQGWKAYLGDDARADHPYAVPLNASRLGGLAPALVLSVASHPLGDEARRYAAALRAQGTAVHELRMDTATPGRMASALRAFLEEATHPGRNALSG